MKLESFSGLIVVALGGVLLFLMIPYGVIDHGGGQNLALSPSFWPKVLAVSLMALGGGLILEGMFKNKRKDLSRDEGRKGLDNDDSAGLRVDWRGWVMLLMLPIYYFLILWLGLVVPSLIMFVVYAFFYSSKKIGSSILWGVVIVICVTMFFVKGAGIVIPLGPINNIF